MPLHYIRSTKAYKLIIWKATEDLEYFYSALGLESSHIDNIKAYKPHRQLELCSTQHALNCLMGEVVTFGKDQFGKPVMDKYPDLHLSLSHTDHYTAVLVTPYRSGLDIQVEREKITRIAPKFLFDHEIKDAEHNKVELFHFYWGIKESVFKAWGRGKVAFREMIDIAPFEVLGNKVLTTAEFDNSTDQLSFRVEGYKLDNLYLSFVIEIK